MEKIKLLLLIILLIEPACNQSNNSIKEDKLVKDQTEIDFFQQKDSSFKSFILNRIGEEKSNHISNINNLKRLKIVNCDSTSIYYKDIIEGNPIELKITIQDFEYEEHKIKYIDQGDYKDCELIDNKYPFGGYYGCPKTEIKNIEIIINNKKLNLDGTFSNLYNIEMCEISFKNFTPNPLLTYSEKNKQFQLYINGGIAAGTYFSKIIFDKEEIIAKYVIDYLELSKQGSFFPEFKGF